MQPLQAGPAADGNGTIKGRTLKPAKQVPPERITIAIFCALLEESVAVRHSLDEKLECRYKTIGPRQYVYSFGRISHHNVVIARPTEVGPVSAALCAATVNQQFPNIRFALMVGIGAGIPAFPKRDIRLGDVAVSIPKNGNPGIFQYDFGKYELDGEFVPKGILNKPPKILLGADALLEEDEMLGESPFSEILEDITKGRGFAKPKSADVLFDDAFHHINKGDDCSGCEASDENIVVSRPYRDESSGEPVIHRGLILSGGGVVKNSADRDRLRRGYTDAICFEMEAAGIADEIPCLVIRGICDYADTHKQDGWHYYAAAVAAAYAKAILLKFDDYEVEEMSTMKEVMLNIENKLHDIDENVHYLKQRANDVKDAKEYEELVDWLKPIDYNPQQNRYIGSRQPETGQWLLDSVEFRNWLEVSKQALFCHGLPGAGKSVIASIVIDYLQADIQTRSNKNEEDRFAMAFVYYDFQQRDQQNPVDILASLLKQLVQKLPYVPESVKLLYNEHKSNTLASCPISDISKALQSVISCYARVFIVIDALDECQQRNKLLAEMSKIRAQTEVNLFVTSRPARQIEIEFNELFDGSISLPIKARDGDVAKYLDGNMSQLPLLNNNEYLPEKTRIEIEAEIKTKIISAASGLFLLARFHFESLIDKTTHNTMTAALNALSKGESALSEAYGKTIERIRSQRDGFRLLAEKVLLLLTCARRPLTISEVRHALAVRAGMSTLDEKDLEHPAIMISVCAGLVTVDEDSRIIRLLHETTREFLETHVFCLRPWDDHNTSESPMAFDQKKNAIAMADTQRTISAICTTYLSLSVFDTGFCQTDNEFEERLQSYPLFDYAAQNWGHHAREALPSGQEVIDFLKREKILEASNQALMAVKRYAWNSDYSQRVPRRMTGLHSAAYFGISTAADNILRGHSTDPKDSYGRTPLWLAARNGHEAVVKSLLDKGADVEAKDNHDGQTALLCAAWNGHAAVVKKLIDTGAKIESSDKDARTPLWWAAQNGHEVVVKLLLGVGADMESRDSYEGRTALLCAAKHGHEAVARLLLDNGANMESKDNCHYRRADEDGHKPDIVALFDGFNMGSKYKGNRTPLLLAAMNGHEAVVKLLLDKGADTTTKDMYGCSPLQHAVQKGHTGVVKALLHNANQAPLVWAAANKNDAVIKILLDEGAGTELKDKNGRTALSWAAQNCSATVVNLLLDNGAEIESKDKDDHTPVWWAARDERIEAINILLGRGADIASITTDYGEKILSRAARHGYDTVAKALLNGGTDVESLGGGGGTPLWLAAQNGHAAVVKVLLDEGADMEYRETYDSQSALLCAAKYGHGVAARLLLEKGADIEAKDKKCRTSLSWAAEKGHEAVVKILLVHRPDAESKDTSGRTPLWWAAGNGHGEIAKLLIQNGAKVELKDTQYDQTPISWAARHGHKEVVRVLLENGADMESKDATYGQTPLSWAARHGHEAVVKILLENGAEIESKDAKDRWTPLTWAARNGCDATIKLLLEGAAKVETKDVHGRTPLLQAAQNGHEVAAGLLIDSGAKVELKDRNGQTPLWWAAENGHGAMMKLLLEKGAKLESSDEHSQTPLLRAAKNGKVAIIKTLLDKGAKIESKDEDGRTSLLWAAMKGHVTVVQMLLERDADTEAKDKHGQTSLSFAASNGYDTIAKMLLDKGAQIESKDDDRRTPLWWAAQKDDMTIAKMLLDKGANIESIGTRFGRTRVLWAAQNGYDATKRLLNNGAAIESNDSDGRTLLSWAAQHGHEPIVQTLLKVGANREAKDKKYGQTPLSWASENGRTAVVEMLLKYGVDTESRDQYDGRTPLSWAATRGQEAVVKALLKGGAQRESKDKDGWTPLWWAAENGHEAIVRLLLEQGAEIESEDNDGRTPLSWAARNGHEAIVTVLLDYGARIEFKDEDGRTPLWWAARNKHMATIKILLDRGANMDSIDVKHGRALLG